ncbi:PREDICTED: uncharacterized protein LOC108764387 isoform X2 [Trachymyrmex cornetzi]|uniref:uncharacterized protein LOC108764387 isoform X2 n=1 Tax=Trachymyrmex cornetzi TaxID=471704 RepID=UPI00084F430A|nr:PREDICTED: uncharacterized protein LOC108764387 isoform X2 [Trachymyrmex cornetzi]
MLVAKICRAGVSPGLASLVRTPVVPTPQFSKGQIARLFVNDGRSSYTRTARRRATVVEQATAPAGETAFNVGKAAVAGGALMGLGGLCYYGLGLSSQTGAIDHAHLWPQYVKDRVKSTYTYFGASIAASAASAAMCLRSPVVMNMIMRQGWVAIGVSLAAMIGSGMIVQGLPYKEGFNSKHMAWLVHTGILGAVVAPLTLLGGALVIRAAWYTAGIVGGLSAIAVSAPSDKFLAMGGPLAIGLGVVFASSLGSMFLPPTTALGSGLYSVALYGGLLLFSGFLLYDTQKIIKQAETYPMYNIHDRPYDPINKRGSIDMRLRESVSVSLHPNGLNNNQLRRHSPSRSVGAGEIGDRNENAAQEPVATPEPDYPNDESADFRLAEDTTTWSSLAIARDNVQQSNPSTQQPVNVNNNLTELRIRRNSSIESLADYEGTIEEQSANVNNNLTGLRIQSSSSIESLTGYEGRNSPHENSSHELTPSEWSDWSEEGNLPAGCRGIVNPNYPGFQHLAPSLLSDTDLTEDEHDSCSDYPPLHHHDEVAPLPENDEYNNNINDSINHLCGQRNDRKIFYEKPKFNIQTVTSLYEAVVPPSEKCINYVKSVEVSKSEEKAFSPEPEEVINGIVEAETHLTLLDEREESLANQITVVDECAIELSQVTFEDKREREVPVEVELVELTTSVNESLQFPEIEEILDSGKTSEIGETEDIVVEHIDLIREAKELPHSDRSKIGNRQPVTTTSTSTGGSVDDDESESNSDYSEGFAEERPTYTKLEEIDLLSSIGRDIGVDLEKYAQPVPDVVAMESIESMRQPRSTSIVKDHMDTNKLLDRQLPEASSADARKKEKMVKNQAKRRQQQQQQQQQQQSRNSNSQRRLDKRRVDIDNGSGGFDVYNIETAMPKIDLDAIESHLRAAREEERRVKMDKRSEPVMETEEKEKKGENLERSDYEREDLITRFDRVIRGELNDDLQRRNDREEIRRRLAMGPDAEDLRAERGRKPSLQSRLQSGMNLQICFMNETSSDTESPGSENDTSPGSTPTSLGSKQFGGKQKGPTRPQMLSLPSLRLDMGANSTPPIDEADFFARQARLQTEARMALAQAKEMAHMQMEVERQRLKQSPITEMVRCSLEKVGVQLGEDRRRLSRVLLTELNVAQLQVVANDLHARIAALNEALVEGLLRRDDLHMEQDSMLVDVEDLTRYLGAKQESLKKKHQNMQQAASRNHQQSSPAPTKLSMKPKLTHLNRGLVALVRK